MNNIVVSTLEDIEMIYNYYCNLDKENCICKSYTKNGWCERMEYGCPHQKENIFNLKEA